MRRVDVNVRFDQWFTFHGDQAQEMKQGDVVLERQMLANLHRRDLSSEVRDLGGRIEPAFSEVFVQISGLYVSGTMKAGAGYREGASALFSVDIPFRGELFQRLADGCSADVETGQKAVLCDGGFCGQATLNDFRAQKVLDLAVQGHTRGWVELCRWHGVPLRKAGDDTMTTASVNHRTTGDSA